ncbi:sarcosine oxidase subunit gamma [Oceanomicrobium pacificus]|uniref:Sarcosine oxidase subunit gamma n=1 Tax=Oceanomicrobium pacificus TaxID=2692916 RepID=A0A6B0TLP7_9RHOB|nr:sarcosine oxidase subunit gamma family protein [Oceanomicrobium pacificus]MXU65470.1 sarcosine oxidase subunit gamma [Oceanomicrobium pacificus]
MSEAVTALAGATYEGAVTVADGGLTGMVQLRADLADAAVATAVKAATGADLPDRRRISAAKEQRLLWMSPDELLILTDHGAAPDLVKRLSTELTGQHALVLDLSDARSRIRLSGQGVREVLAKGAPVDLAPGRFEPGEVRRTRIGQIAAAFWLLSETEAEVICFRSVAPFLFDWLSTAARPGSLPGHFR